MSLTVASPGALWLLLILPLTWLAAHFGRTNFNGRQRLLQAAIRSLLLATLALGLARPVVSTASSRLSVVYLVDVSHSIASWAIADAAAKIDALNAGVKPDQSRIVAFGADSAVLADTAALRTIGASDVASNAGPVRRDASDLEFGLTAARAELLPGAQPRIVLFSDGRETSGDARAAITRLAAEGVPVFVSPLGVREIGDAWVQAIVAPDRVSAGAYAKVTVTLGSQRAAGEAMVEIREGPRVLGTTHAHLEAGTIPVTLDVKFDTEGPHVIEATLMSSGDPLAANNRLSREVLVEPRVRVLYVEGVAASARYLADALTQGGFEVTVRARDAIPRTLEALSAWDVVILSDLPRVSIPDDAMAALAIWVEQEGGGLLVAGGDSVFGEGKDGAPTGYRRTEIERLMPVTFERKDEPQVALIMVLDKSFSMNGKVMDLCKSAAEAALDVLTDEQTLGVISFNDQITWDVLPANVGRNRAAMRQAIASIEPDGRTLIYPAIEQAYLALKKVRAGAKHVVLLSDGRSYPDDYEGLVKKMVDAKITVSTVAVGVSADAELLGNIATWGKGKSYAVQDAREVTQIFVKEAKDASTPSFVEGDTIAPVVKTKSFLKDVDLTRMPPLTGRTAVVLKDAATELLASDKNDPLLAFWPIGLGRTAVFAPDVKDRWASAWLKWPEYGPFFSAVVRELARQRSPAMLLEVTPGVVRGNRRALSVSLEARDSRGGYQDLLKPVVELRSASGGSADLPTRQVAPGRYEANVTADVGEPLTVSLAAPAGSVAPTRNVLPDLNAEYRFQPPDDALLHAIASATGGVFNPRADDLRRATGTHQAERRAIWPLLVAAALVLWLLDILLRRVRLFEAA